MYSSGRKKKVNPPNRPEKQELEAAALSYDSGRMSAPMVSAAGRKDVAREMKSVARRYGVSVVHDPQLAAELCRLGQSETVPPRLYKEVARAIVNAGRHK